MNKRHYEHTLPNIRGSLSNTYDKAAKQINDIPEISRPLPHLQGDPILGYRLRKREIRDLPLLPSLDLSLLAEQIDHMNTDTAPPQRGYQFPDVAAHAIKRPPVFIIEQIQIYHLFPQIEIKQIYKRSRQEVSTAPSELSDSKPAPAYPPAKPAPTNRSQSVSTKVSTGSGCPA
mgnify:CR=1 FL=1